MNVEVSIALDILALLFMLILLFSISIRRIRYSPLNSRCSSVILATLSMLSLDIIYMLTYGKTDELSHTLMKLSKTFYLISNSLIVILWASFLYYRIFGSQYKKRNLWWMFPVLFGINCGLLVVNYFTGTIFTVTAVGELQITYIGMWSFTLVNYFAVFVSLITLIIYNKHLKTQDFVPQLLFPLLPLIAEIVQLINLTYSLDCVYAVSALLIFQSSQTNMMFIDELTGLSTRKILSEYLDRIFSKSSHEGVCGIMIDLDGLKHFNDTYGHLAGDNAIITIGEIITGVCCMELTHNRILAVRYGGDEFVLVWTAQNAVELISVTNALNNEKLRINSSKSERERVDFSMGTTFCAANRKITANDFLREIDNDMYAIKQNKHITVNEETAMPNQEDT